ncbi:MAG: nicotinamide mononucleotide transporter [Bacteroidetes bacterium]|nr:nicotinamide mononucleotide transporter [Bacteroidota bacterium]
MDFFSNPIEIVSVFCSLVFIIGAARQKVWAWSFGIVGAFLASILFYEEKLYSESYLQILYVILGFYGWWKWIRLKKQNEQQNEKKNTITELKWGIHVVLLLTGFILTFITGWYFKNFTQAHFPYIDAFTTSFAIIATFLEAKKILSCWYYWLVVNPISLGLFIVKGLHLYSVLGIIFTLMSVYGLVSWLKSVKQ